MKKKYPRANNCLIYSKIEGGTYLAEDISSNEEWELDASTVSFLRRLDGRTPPSCICPEMSARERKEFLHELQTEGLIKNAGRLHMEGLFFWRFTLWMPERRYPKKAAAAANRILFLVALPILAGGGLIYINNYSDALAAAWNYGELITAGLLLGLAAGIIFHEAAHAAAGIAYGAHVCEFGLMLYLLLPGAYVIMDEKNVKSTAKRIQIYAAGVEANFALTGIFLFLAAAVPPLFWMFSQAALCNGFLAVFNLSVMGGLDGMKIFGEVMGNRDLPGTVLDVLIPDSEQDRDPARGINGCALKAASAAVVLFHLAFVCTIITNIAVFLIE